MPGRHRAPLASPAAQASRAGRAGGSPGTATMSHRDGQDRNDVTSWRLRRRRRCRRGAAGGAAGARAAGGASGAGGVRVEPPPPGPALAGRQLSPKEPTATRHPCRMNRRDGAVGAGISGHRSLSGALEHQEQSRALRRYPARRPPLPGQQTPGGPLGRPDARTPEPYGRNGSGISLRYYALDPGFIAFQLVRPTRTVMPGPTGASSRGDARPGCGRGCRSRPRSSAARARPGSRGR